MTNLPHTARIHRRIDALLIGITIVILLLILLSSALAGSRAALAGALTLDDNSIIQLALGAGNTHSTLARTGSGTWTFDTFLSPQTGTYTGLTVPPNTAPGSWTITNSGWSGTFVYDGSGDIDLTPTGAPEPSTWIGGALTLAAVACTQRRRLRKLVRKGEGGQLLN